MTRKSLYLIGWSLIIVINFYFIYNFPLNHFNYKSWIKPFGPLLTTHIVFGMIAILIGPFQFFPSIRNKYPFIHRLTGRTYLLSITIAGIAATVLAINHNIIVQNRIVFGTGLLGLAAAWFVTSGMAFWAIKKRNFVQHREWMVKSYVVTCGFTTFRIFAVTLNNYIQLDYGKEMSGIMAWACWSVPLLVTEVFLQAKKIRRASVIQKPAANHALPQVEA
jgi:Predicted membrane protein (DUF2306)